MRTAHLVMALVVAAASTVLTPARAGQKVISELHGEVTAKNYKALEKFVAKNLDKVVGLQIDVQHTGPNDASRLRADAGGDGQLAIYLSSTPQESTESEIVASDGYSFLHGSYVFDGFFPVKSGGMHQGAVSYGLMRVDEAAIRLNPSVEIRKIQLPR